MSEHRTQKRQHRKEDAYLEITVNDDSGEYIQKVIACETVDVSERGLKIYMSEEVAHGTVTDLCVVLSGQEGRFFLKAEVKWISTTGDDGWYFAGFEIYDADNTDYDKWLVMVRERKG
ncbi:MAG TPA: PilZ domain-containing protein [Dongiaceae bacterium]|nr:PilZ domain-containing protein [Dongiaceae bacterium]